MVCIEERAKPMGMGGGDCASLRGRRPIGVGLERG